MVLLVLDGSSATNDRYVVLQSSPIGAAIGGQGGTGTDRRGGGKVATGQAPLFPLRLTRRPSGFPDYNAIISIA